MGKLFRSPQATANRLSQSWQLGCRGLARKRGEPRKPYTIHPSSRALAIDGNTASKASSSSCTVTGVKRQQRRRKDWSNAEWVDHRFARQDFDQRYREDRDKRSEARDYHKGSKQLTEGRSIERELAPILERRWWDKKVGHFDRPLLARAHLTAPRNKQKGPRPKPTRGVSKREGELCPPA